MNKYIFTFIIGILVGGIVFAIGILFYIKVDFNNLSKIKMVKESENIKQNLSDKVEKLNESIKPIEGNIEWLSKEASNK